LKTCAENRDRSKISETQLRDLLERLKEVSVDSPLKRSSAVTSIVKGLKNIFAGRASSKAAESAVLVAEGIVLTKNKKDPNWLQGRSYLERAIKLGNRDGYYRLGLVYTQEGEGYSAKKIFLEGAKKGSPDCQREFAKTLRKGFMSRLYPEVIEEAEKWLKRSAKAGDTEAMYLFGVDSIKDKKSEAKGISLLQQVVRAESEHGHPKGEFGKSAQKILLDLADTLIAAQELEKAAKVCSGVSGNISFKNRLLKLPILMKPWGNTAKPATYACAPVEQIL
jgi:hypothetical protein